MAKIHSITIKNFRGINELSHTFSASDFVCLIGRGDSGKSTILEAISFVLSPNWNIPINDSDFYNCSVATPIEIEASLVEVPDELLSEDKCGLYIRGLNPSTGEIHDEIEDDHEKVITIKLTIDKDLEPQWHVINERQAPKLISANDRARLNTFLVSDYLDRHFSWNKGSPLYSLLRQEISEEEEEHVIIDALRDAKKTIDGHPFSEFDSVTKKITDCATTLGINISGTSTSVDFKDLFMRDGKVSLHGNSKVPFRLKGKGSKRLISIAIQMALVEFGGIILIDEIEQGLEPDRVQHLVNILKANNKGQIFITTHSRDVLIELGAENLLRVVDNEKSLIQFNSSLNACLRKNPEAFFAKKIIVCEGPTEIGVCRAVNTYKIKKSHKNASHEGVRFADGSGDNLVNYVESFIKSKFEVCLFCDSDNQTINAKKEGFKTSKVEIIDWDNNNCLEQSVVKHLPVEVIPELLNLAASLKNEENPEMDIKVCKQSICDSIKAKGSELPTKFTSDSVSEKLRSDIGKAASTGKWFKSQTKGEVLGDLILKHIENFPAENFLKKQLNRLSVWIDGNGL